MTENKEFNLALAFLANKVESRMNLTLYPGPHTTYAQIDEKVLLAFTNTSVKRFWSRSFIQKYRIVFRIVG